MLITWLHLQENSINAIKLGNLFQYPTLIAVDDNGGVCVYNAEFPMKYPPIYFKNPGSTWSMDMSSNLGVQSILKHSSTVTSEFLNSLIEEQIKLGGSVVLGSNSYNGTFISLSQISEAWDHINPIINENIQSIELDVEINSVFEHSHNVPSVSLSSCGRFLATASIDAAVRIWDTKTKKLLFAGQDADWLVFVLHFPTTIQT